MNTGNDELVEKLNKLLEERSSAEMLVIGEEIEKVMGRPLSQLERSIAGLAIAIYRKKLVEY